MWNRTISAPFPNLLRNIQEAGPSIDQKQPQDKVTNHKIQRLAMDTKVLTCGRKHFHCFLHVLAEAQLRHVLHAQRYLREEN